MKLFRIKRPSEAQADSAAASAARFAWEAAARTHAGAVRKLNEDRFVGLPQSGVWAIADGMGGHRNGDVAAETVVDAIALAQPRSADEVEAAIEESNRILRDRAAGAPDCVSGATVVALLLKGGVYHCLWAGDSELFLLRGGHAHKLTRDHTLVEEMIQAGVVPPEERRTHPQGHIVTRAIGASDSANLDRLSGSLQDGDLFLLCSDGLTGAVDPRSFEALDTNGSLDGLADGLLEQALANGASDNVTVVLVRVHRRD